jgi:hypothetical protein
MVRRLSRYVVLAVAVIAAMATGAQADVFLLQSGGNLPTGDAGELAFVEAATGDDLSLLFKTPGADGSTGTCPSGPDCISATSGGGTSAEVFWADLSTSLNWILIVDGSEGVGHECTGTTGGTGGKCYALWGVTDAQLFDSNGNQIISLPEGSGGTSHISFFTAGTTPPPPVPEPSLLILLGTGLFGTLTFARRLM